MTRDTDSSSSGPQGRGGAAYPSGTQPYGAGRPFPSLHPQERARAEGGGDAEDAAAAGQEGGAEEQQAGPDEPRTETTLTTRIRINIPGSRPIPPVVVRTAVDEPNAASGAGPGAGAGSGSASGAGEGAGDGAEQEPGGAEGAAAAPEEKKTSDWFSPRKPAQQQAAPPAPPQAPGARTGETTAAGLPFRTGSGAASGASGTQGGGRVPFADTEATGALPYPPPPPAEDQAVRGGHDTPAGGFASPFAGGSPYDTGAMSSVQEGGSPYDTGAMSPVQEGGSPYDTGAMSPVQEGGSPYDTGAMPPVQEGGSLYDTGANPVFDVLRDPAAEPPAADPYDTGAQPFGTEDFPPGVPRPTDAGDRPDAPFGGRLDAPAGPTAGPATGSVEIPPLDPPTGGGASGDTLVSGIPTVPSAPSAGGPRFPEPPRRQTPPFAGAPARAAAEREPAPAEPAPKPAAKPAAKPAKKPRSKAALAGVGVVAVLVVAYGAGLVMNHSDVPKGTTVLGVDIGNQNRGTAAKMLDDAIGDRASAPLTLDIGGEKKTLKPSVAGLSVDTDATVQEVAHSDYNPVSVIGSLFGGSRTADPVYVMDEDKLKVALTSLAGNSRAGTEGMVRFEDHKAVAVPGKPGRTFDVEGAVTLVEAAYRTRLETGEDAPVEIEATATQPKVTKDDLDKAVNGFGKRAMSGPVVILTDAAHQVTFDKTLPQFLTMTATQSGELAPHIDLAKLKALYGRTFDGVLLERGNGSKTPVTVKDVATALMQALNASGAGRTVDLQDAL